VAIFMQQLLLFGAPQALNSSAGAGADSGASMSSNRALNQALLSDSAGFAEAMRSVLVAQSGSVAPANGEGVVDVSFSTELLELPLSAVKWQQSAASFDAEGQLLPLSPSALQPGQIEDLSETSSTIQALLNSRGLVADAGNVADGGSLSPIAGQDAEDNVMSALGFVSDVSGGVQPPSPVTPELVPQFVGAERPSLATETNHILPSAAVTVTKQTEVNIQSALAPVSTPTPVEAAARVAGSSSVLPNVMERPTNRAGNTVAGSVAQASTLSADGASLGAGTGQVVNAATSLSTVAEPPVKAGATETVMQVGQSVTAEVSTSESQRQLASQWNSYLQGGGASQPSAQSDVNFKLSMEQALAGTDADPGGDIPDELLAKLSEPAAPKAQELSQRASAAADKPYSSSVNVPVGDPEWGAKMNEKVVWLSGRGIQSAQIHLNPVELGPVDVKVSVQNDQTVITFNVQNAGVKELLESNVQRLRDMIDQNGNAEIEVNVEERSSSREGLAQNQQNSQQDGRGTQGSAEQTDGIEEAVSVTGISNIDNVSLVDYYA
jgi:flagellar hook-length control protein FliK